MWFFLGLAVLAVATLCMLFYRGSARWSGSGRVAGVEYKGTSNKGKLQAVVVGAPTRASVEFEVKREGWFDQLGKSLGLSVEGQTGNRGFDDGYYLICDDEYLLVGLHHDPDLTEAMRDVFGFRATGAGEVKRLVCRGGKVRVHLGATGEAGDEQRIARDLAPMLLELSQRLDASAGTVRRDRLFGRAAWIGAVAWGLAITGALEGLRHAMSTDLPDTVSNAGLFRVALLPAAVVVGGLALLAWRWFARTSRGHLALGEAVLVGGFGALATSLALVADLNRELDTSTPRHQRAEVIDKHTTRSRKGGTKYYLTLAGGAFNGGSIEYRVDNRTYNTVPEHGPVVLTTHDGWLALEWVSAIERDPRGDDEG
jgi:hypothetical protein